MELKYFFGIIKAIYKVIFVIIKKRTIFKNFTNNHQKEYVVCLRKLE